MSDAAQVLVIDDEPATVRLLVELLRGSGFALRVALAAGDGWRKAVTHQPDAILLDICMPALDGLHLCRLLKDDPRTADIPVLLLLLLPAAQAGQPVVAVSPGAERLPLGRDMTYLLDPGGTLDAPAAPASPGWRPVDAPSLNLGFRKDVVWVRLALHNAAPDDLERWLRLEPQHLEQLSLFAVLPDTHRVGPTPALSLV